MTVTALVRATRLGWGNVTWFLSGWLTSELAVFHVLVFVGVLFVLGVWCWSVAFLLLWPGPPRAAGHAWVAWAGLAVAQWRARPVALGARAGAWQAGLGADYRARSRPGAGARRAVVPPRELPWPFPIRDPSIERMRDLAYADGARRPRSTSTAERRPTGAPVLLQVHGGGWVLGNKNEQGLPLMWHLAERGWVGVSPTTDSAPGALSRPPGRLEAGDRMGPRQRGGPRGRPGRSGRDRRLGRRSPGGPVGPDRERPEHQPGLEALDAASGRRVPFYGVYDFVKNHRHGTRRATARRWCGWLERTVMPGAPAHVPAVWDLASPIAQLRPRRAAVLRAARHARLARERRGGAAICAGGCAWFRRSTVVCMPSCPARSTRGKSSARCAPWSRCRR